MPNITGGINFLSRELSASGAFRTTSSYPWRPAAEGGTETRGIAFDASRGAENKDIYKNGCLAVKPKSFGVYMWKRTG